MVPLGGSRQHVSLVEPSPQSELVHLTVTGGIALAQRIGQKTGLATWSVVIEVETGDDYIFRFHADDALHVLEQFLDDPDLAPGSADLICSIRVQRAPVSSDQTNRSRHHPV
jgi:hypothetical protein